MVSPADISSDVDPQSPITFKQTRQKQSQKGTSSPQQMVQGPEAKGKQPLGRGVPPPSASGNTHTQSSSSSSSFIIDHTSSSSSSSSPVSTDTPATQQTPSNTSPTNTHNKKAVSFRGIHPLQIQAITEDTRMAQEKGREHYFGILKAKLPRSVPKSSKLKVAVQTTFADGTTKNLQALVDTGAEVSLINPGLVNPDIFQPSLKPVRLGVANSHSLPGGTQLTTLVLTFDARDQDTGNKRQLSLPLTAYDAAVVCDIILS